MNRIGADLRRVVVEGRGQNLECEARRDAVHAFVDAGGILVFLDRLLIVSPNSTGTACPLSGRNSTYRLVQISAAGSPGRDPSAGEYANDEDSRAHHDTGRPRGQQFGPPQASRTGALCTEAAIAVPVPIASISRAKIANVIFIASPT